MCRDDSPWEKAEAGVSPLLWACRLPSLHTHEPEDEGRRRRKPSALSPVRTADCEGA